MFKKNLFSVSQLVRCAMVAALYVVLCVTFAPLSYGAVQVRFAEILTLLPVFGPEYILAVTLGCLLSNLIGSTVIDAAFGTLATLLACLITYRLRNLRVKGLAIPAAIPPVVFNAVIVGLEISLFFSDVPATLPLVLWNGLTVGIGEIISCMVLGVGMVKIIERTPALRSRLAQP